MSLCTKNFAGEEDKCLAPFQDILRKERGGHCMNFGDSEEIAGSKEWQDGCEPLPLEIHTYIGRWQTSCSRCNGDFPNPFYLVLVSLSDRICVCVSNRRFIKLVKG